MNQDFSIERLVSGLASDGSFDGGGVKVSMDGYYSHGPEGRKLNPNWPCVLSGELKEQGRSFTPQDLYRALPDSRVKEQTNLPIMSAENYFRLVKSTEESREVFAVPDALRSMEGDGARYVALYLSFDKWYDELVRADKRDIVFTLSDFLLREEDPCSEKHFTSTEAYRSSLPYLNFEKLERIAKPLLPSEEETDKIKDYLEGIYSKVDEYVQAGEDIFNGSLALGEDVRASMSLERLFFQLNRLANNEQYANYKRWGCLHVTPRLARNEHYIRNESFEPSF